MSGPPRAVVCAVFAVAVLAGIGIAGGVVAGESAAVAGNATTSERPIDIDTERVSIYLQSQRTVVGHDERVVFTHSATNYVTNREDLTVQLILEAPSGATVSGTAGVQEGSGSQFTTVTTLAPGEQDSVRITVDFLEPGAYEIRGRAIYYFGGDRDTGEGVAVTIPVEQRPPPPSPIERLGQGASGLLGAVPDTYGRLVGVLESQVRAGGFVQMNMPVLIMYAFLSGLVGTGLLLALIAPVSSWSDSTVETAFPVAFFVPFVLLLFDVLSPTTLLLPRFFAGLLMLTSAVVLTGLVAYLFGLVYARVSA
jgi:hypothetical protein